ncbi:hypothetical protein [Dysgonomonas termitidis]|uniref:Uncharacterized protein n=1 Tax=Dysgonomonas termitidis TaxID=1516126 RepID=A0ABV9L3F2_9BACT
MKKCRIVKTENGFAVRGTNFLNHCDADMYAYYLANSLNNGGKLIYVANVDEAIEKHNQLEEATNADWLRVCWNRNAGCYLHTKNVYALKDNSLHGNIYQFYKDADQWWEYMTNETKAVISGIDSQTATEYHYRAYWAKIQPSDKNCIHKYWRRRNGLIRLDEDDAKSLQMEVICELADLQLEQEYSKSREDMCDENGSFYEDYQDRFNDIYDDIEARLLDNEL